MTAMTPDEFARYMNSPIEYELGKATRAGMTDAAQAVKAAVQSSIMSKAPNGLKTRKGGARGKVSAFYNVYGHVNAFAIVAARGPLPLIENDTKPHIIAPSIGRAVGRGAKAANARTSAARRTGYLGGALGRRTGLLVTGSYTPGGLATFARHPGTKGSRPFAKAVDAIEDTLPAHIERSLGPVGD